MIVKQKILVIIVFVQHVIKSTIRPTIHGEKKIVGIAILTDIAIRQMEVRHKPKLILVTKEDFPNSALVRREIQRYVKNIEFNLYSSNNFISSFINLIEY